MLFSTFEDAECWSNINHEVEVDRVITKTNNKEKIIYMSEPISYDYLSKDKLEEWI